MSHSNSRRQESLTLENKPHIDQVDTTRNCAGVYDPLYITVEGLTVETKIFETHRMGVTKLLKAAEIILKEHDQLVESRKHKFLSPMSIGSLRTYLSEFTGEGAVVICPACLRQLWIG
jgi:hypothetical protein